MISGIFFMVVAMGIIIWMLIKRHQHQITVFNRLSLVIVPILMYLGFNCFMTNPKTVAKNQQLLTQQTNLIEQQHQAITSVALASPNSDEVMHQRQKLVHIAHQLQQTNQNLKKAQLTMHQYQIYQANQKRQHS